MKSFLMFLLIIFLACGVATLGVVFLDDSIGDFGASEDTEATTQEPETEEPQTYTVRGKYVFNMTIEFPEEGFNEPAVTFEMNYGDHTEGQGLFVQIEEGPLLGFGVKELGGIWDPVYMDGAWISVGLIQLINFGEDPQEISKECYDFLMQNGSFAPTSTVSGFYMFNEGTPVTEGYEGTYRTNGTFTLATGDVCYDFHVSASWIDCSFEKYDGMTDPLYVNGAWRGDDFRLLDFGDVPHEITGELYMFLKKNGSFYAADPTKMTITGEWEWNEFIAVSQSAMAAPISFTYGDGDSMEEIAFHDDGSIWYGAVVAYENGVWNVSRKMDFGSTGVTVTSDFAMQFYSNVHRPGYDDPSVQTVSGFIRLPEAFEEDYYVSGTSLEDYVGLTVHDLTFINEQGETQHVDTLSVRMTTSIDGDTVAGIHVEGQGFGGYVYLDGKGWGAEMPWDWRVIELGAEPRKLPGKFIDMVNYLGAFTGGCGDLSPMISGVWTVKDDPTFGIDTNFDLTILVPFDCGGGEYSSIRLYCLGTDAAGNPELGIDYDGVMVYNPGGWVMNEYKTLDFGDDGGYYGYVFYCFVMDNMTPVV